MASWQRKIRGEFTWLRFSLLLNIRIKILTCFFFSFSFLLSLSPSFCMCPSTLMPFLGQLVGLAVRKERNAERQERSRPADRSAHSGWVSTSYYCTHSFEMMHRLLPLTVDGKCLLWHPCLWPGGSLNLGFNSFFSFSFLPLCHLKLKEIALLSCLCVYLHLGSGLITLLCTTY